MKIDEKCPNQKKTKRRIKKEMIDIVTQDNEEKID